MSFQYKNVYWLWASAIVIFLDQIAKQLIVRNLNWYDVVPVLPHLNIVYIKNTGAAFSMMSDASPVLFVLLGVGVSVGILLWLRRHPRDQPIGRAHVCPPVTNAHLVCRLLLEKH